MKILHTSDWHLGRVLHGQSLIKDQTHMLEQVRAELGKGYDALVVAGDIFDRAVAPAVAMTLLNDFLDDVRGLQVPVVMIPGNHDSMERLSYGASFFEQHGIHIRCGYHRVEPVTVTGSDGLECDVFTMPFVEHALVGEQLEDESVVDKESAVKAVLDRMEPFKRPDVPSILVAHEFIAGAEESESERVFIGGSHVVSASLFNGFTFVALGHLHKHQEAGLSHIYYCGSPLAYSFGEADNKHCLLSVSIDAGKSVTRERIKVHPHRPMSVLADTFDNLIHADKYALQTSHYVSARITDPGYHLNLQATLRERFPFLLEVRLLEVERRLKQTSEREVMRSDDPMAVFNAFIGQFDWEPGSEDWESAQKLYEEAAEAVRKAEVAQ